MRDRTHDKYVVTKIYFHMTFHHKIPALPLAMALPTNAYVCTILMCELFTNNSYRCKARLDTKTTFTIVKVFLQDM